MSTVTVRIVPEINRPAPVRIKAQRFGAFAIHRRWCRWCLLLDGFSADCLTCAASGPWTVTHRPSGLKACDVRSRRQGLLVARRLMGLPIEWRQPEPLRGVRTKVRERAMRIAQGAEHD